MKAIREDGDEFLRLYHGKGGKKKAVELLENLIKSYVCKYSLSVVSKNLIYWCFMVFVLSSLKALQSVCIFINVSNASFGEVHTASFYCLLNVNTSSICNISNEELVEE